VRECDISEELHDRRACEHTEHQNIFHQDTNVNEYELVCVFY
jgi:hypothetical protein